MGGNVALNATESSGLSPVVGGPTSTATCDAGSPAGFCDQFHEVRFSDEPCLVSGAELALDAAFLCAAGSEAEQLPAGEVSSDNSGMVAGIAGAVVGAAMLAIGIVLVVVIRRRRRSARERSASDAPL